MTKADIVNEITKNTGIDKVTVLTTLEAFMDTVKDSLSKEENVYSKMTISPSSSHQLPVQRTNHRMYRMLARVNPTHLLRKKALIFPMFCIVYFSRSSIV